SHLKQLEERVESDYANNQRVARGEENDGIKRDLRNGVIVALSTIIGALIGGDWGAIIFFFGGIIAWEPIYTSSVEKNKGSGQGAMAGGGTKDIPIIGNVIPGNFQGGIMGGTHSGSTSGEQVKIMEIQKVKVSNCNNCWEPISEELEDSKARPINWWLWGTLLYLILVVSAVFNYEEHSRGGNALQLFGEIGISERV
ncbi:4143_t:CDS:2, partial [Cetraspora pellucida]